MDSIKYHISPGLINLVTFSFSLIYKTYILIYVTFYKKIKVNKDMIIKGN